jgi:hypothetical protein
MPDLSLPVSGEEGVSAKTDLRDLETPGASRLGGSPRR